MLLNLAIQAALSSAAHAFAAPFEKPYFEAKQSVNYPSPHNILKKSVGKHKQNQRNKYK
jgi:hypothetical protein